MGIPEQATLAGFLVIGHEEPRHDTTQHCTTGEYEAWVMTELIPLFLSYDKAGWC
jgi:hypothetical protein